jgi:hypothetical protein
MDSHGMLPSMFSVGKIDYNDALDGISLTNTITPDGLGRDEDERVNNLVGILDAGNGHGLYHANINVLRKEQLEDAVENPDKYPHLTVRVSGYAVNFVKLTKRAAARRDLAYLPPRCGKRLTIFSGRCSAVADYRAGAGPWSRHPLVHDHCFGGGRLRCLRSWKGRESIRPNLTCSRNPKEYHAADAYGRSVRL